MKIFSLNTSIVSLLASALVAACGGGGGGETAPPVTNKPPTISGSPMLAISAGSSYSFMPAAADPDGDNLSFAITNMPYWASFDEVTGELSGSPMVGNIGDYAQIMISVSDGKAAAQLAPFALMVTPQQLGQANFSALGDTFPTDDGYQSVGTLVMNTGEREQQFDNSDLTLSFDEEGNLLDLFGETDLPTEITDNVAINSGVKAVVGMMTGAQINADPDFGIQLIDEITYFVFYVGNTFNMTIGDPDDPSISESVTLEPPASGEIVVISDPTDPFLYYFASIPTLGELGFGNSYNGLIPFKPSLDYPGLDSFAGHTLEKASFDIGIRAFDFFNISGLRVIKEPQFGDIDWQDPLNSSIEFRAGINGDLDFSFSVLGVGLFSFDLVEASTTFDVGLDRQQAAIALQLAPDNSWEPDWFHFIPAGEINGEALVNGSGEFEFQLSGLYESEILEASLSGLMRIDNDAVTLAGATTGDGEALEVSIEFAASTTTGRVKFPDSFAGSIKEDVTAALDREIAFVEDMLAELEEAISDYEFEVSLRGIREDLPAAMDQAIAKLNEVPGIVYTRAHNGTRDYMNGVCVSYYLGTACLKDWFNVGSYARTAGNKARDAASSAIASPRSIMSQLKAAALQADDEQLREGLRQALSQAYDNRRFSQAFTYTHDFGFPFGEYQLYKNTYTRDILTAAQADQVKTARDNAHRIQETSDHKISVQQVYDELPIREIIDEVRQEVEDALTVVPIPEGLGFSVSGTTVSAFVTVSGEDHGVSFNILNPEEMGEGVADLISDLLIADKE